VNLLLIPLLLWMRSRSERRSSAALMGERGQPTSSRHSGGQVYASTYRGRHRLQFGFFCSFRVKFMRLTKQRWPRPPVIALRYACSRSNPAYSAKRNPERKETMR